MKELEPYLPSQSVPLVNAMLKGHNFELKVVRPRKTKLGEFRFIRGREGAISDKRITINSDLSKDEFLITLVHEVAHMKVIEKFVRPGKPHGSKWKAIYSGWIEIMWKASVFGEALNTPIKNHLRRPMASSCADPELRRALMKANGKLVEDNTMLLEDVPEGAWFCLQGDGKRQFRKLSLRKTRYLCEERFSQKQYLVPGLAVVEISV